MRTEASEPLVAYNTPNLQGLKNRIIESLDTAVDDEKLQRCLELLSEDEMPCRFTEEELDEEIRLSEASGFATDEEVAAMFAKWRI